jgi:hypothetical protein
MESSLLDDASAFELLPNEVILSLFAFLNGIDICEYASFKFEIILTYP